jgi:hypothetical protein
MTEATGPSVTGQSRGLYSSDPIDIMSSPPIPDDWPTNWNLVAYLDQLTAGGVIDVVVTGNRVQIGDDGSDLIVRCDGRTYPARCDGRTCPAMVVDDEICVLLSDEPA